MCTGSTDSLVRWFELVIVSHTTVSADPQRTDGKEYSILGEIFIRVQLLKQQVS